MRDLTEQQFQDLVVDLARMAGWWVMHHRVSIGTQAGWPDLTLIKGEQLEFIELKTARGRVSTEQARVHGLLAAAGHPVHVFRPDDWDRVVDMLTASRGGGL